MLKKKKKGYLSAPPHHEKLNKKTKNLRKYKKGDGGCSQNSTRSFPLYGVDGIGPSLTSSHLQLSRSKKKGQLGVSRSLLIY